MFCTDVAKVANFDGPEEELVVEDSPIGDCLPGLSFCFNRAMAAMCLLPRKCCVT
jgi:hypothetical protein